MFVHPFDEVADLVREGLLTVGDPLRLVAGDEHVETFLRWCITKLRSMRGQDVRVRAVGEQGVGLHPETTDVGVVLHVDTPWVDAKGGVGQRSHWVADCMGHGQLHLVVDEEEPFDKPNKLS